MKYVKPEFMVEEFGLNESIALCEPEEVTKSVTIHCLKTNKHEIFESNCSTQYTLVDDNIITYGGQEYLYWPLNDSSYGQDIDCDSDCSDCNKNEDLFDTIVKAQGWSQKQAGVHIAPITQELQSVINFSQ